MNIVQLEGANYKTVLNEVHLTLRPKRYLEIGVETGASLSLAKEGCFAIGVDPDPRIICDLRAWTQIYKMTSEQFFATYSGEPFDLIFIDGLHQFKAVAQDFIGAEKLTHSNTLMLFHDPIPLTKETSQPEFTRGFWTGDVWKLIPALIEARPDLKVKTMPCSPSGITFVSGFSTPKGLSKEIIKKYDKKDFSWINADWQKLLNVDFS
jgi:hypothetical protein